MLIEAAGCPYAIIGKARTNCGPLYDTFETAAGWVTRPAPHRHGDGRRLAASRPGPDHAPGRDRHVRLASPRHRSDGRDRAEFVRRRWGRDDDPIGAGRVACLRRAAHLPVHVLARLECVGGGLVPDVRGGRQRGSDAASRRSSAPRTPTCRPGRRPRSRCRPGRVRPSASSSPRRTSGRPARSKPPSTTSGSSAR